MDTQSLIENMIDQIKEGQLKLGYVKETVRLYYPLSSMNELLGTDFLNARDLVKVLNAKLLRECEIPGGIWVGFQGERIEVSVSPQGVEYIYENIKASEFLVDIIQLFKSHHSCTIEEICQVFEKYSNSYVCEKMPRESDFDYVVYFPDGLIDKYYYCIKMEMGHTIYHRFTKADYELFS